MTLCPRLYSIARIILTLTALWERMEDMEEWDTVLQEWFPAIIRKKNYPIKISKQYTSSQRWEIYERLTKPQRELVDKHRRYLIKSRFIEENYLAATDWVFADFQINPFYRSERRQKKLFCECGRELKVQYLVKSPKTGKVLKLGINHFAEHLHVTPAVASSINQGMTKVDLAMDELLWLKQQNIDFPHELWQEYQFALYQNQRLKHPYQPDEALASRVADFEKAGMPIYIEDYQKLEQEIKRIQERFQDSPKKRYGKKELFTDFSEELTRDVQEFLTNYQLFLRKDWTGLLTEKKQELPAAFFADFIQLLRKTKRNETEENRQLIQIFSEQQRFIHPKIYFIVWEKYCRYGFTEGFFYSIPRVLRNGFLKVLRKEKQEPLTLTEENWQQIKEALQQTGAADIQKEWQAKGYRFTDTQKKALSYYQTFANMLKSEEKEVQKLVKELFT